MPLLAIVGVSALGLGLILALADTVGLIPGRPSPSGPAANISAATPSANETSQVTALALQSPANRAGTLAAIANQPQPSLEQLRARYVLASDLISQGQSGQAIPLLETLAEDYPLLAVYSRVKLGEAQKASGDAESAQQTWKGVLQDYGKQAAAAEALFQLGKQQSEYWDQLIQRFPAHPRSVEVAAKQLIENPNPANEKTLLLVMTRHGIYHSEVLRLVDRLVAKYGAQLTPEEWQSVGFAYWERQSYGAAGKAYNKAPATPQTRYRAARGLQLGGEQRTAAIAAYQALNAQFPEAPETATGLLRLADMVSAKLAIGWLDQVIERFPNHAGEAMIAKAEVLESLKSSESAEKAREIVLTQYSDSEAAAELRARYARNAGAAGNWSGALKWANTLLQENKDADIAPEIGFWAGKWALRAGQTAEAANYFKQVLRDYPESYFAWRSAATLGWEVGDFETVRSLQPDIALPVRRTLLPSGSDVLQELYLLGQNRDAWSLWQMEFSNPEDPSVADQFTDGVLRLGVGDNLDGIFMV
ncbi:MAG: tetratricopeptide repeat protein, partial [Cyanobacteria bacterium J06626_23]